MALQLEDSNHVNGQLHIITGISERHTACIIRVFQDDSSWTTVKMKATRSSETSVTTYSKPSVYEFSVYELWVIKMQKLITFKIYEPILSYTIYFLSQAHRCFRRLLSAVVGSRIISNTQILVLMTSHLEHILLLKYVVKLHLCHTEVL